MAVLWLVCGLFYDSIRDCFRTLFVAVLWLVCGLFMAYLWFGLVVVFGKDQRCEK